MSMALFGSKSEKGWKMVLLEVHEMSPLFMVIADRPICVAVNVMTSQTSLVERLMMGLAPKGQGHTSPELSTQPSFMVTIQRSGRQCRDRVVLATLGAKKR